VKAYLVFLACAAGVVGCSYDLAPHRAAAGAAANAPEDGSLDVERDGSLDVEDDGSADAGRDSSLDVVGDGSADAGGDGSLDVAGDLGADGDGGDAGVVAQDADVTETGAGCRDGDPAECRVCCAEAHPIAAKPFADSLRACACGAPCKDACRDDYCPTAGGPVGGACRACLAESLRFNGACRDRINRCDEPGCQPYAACVVSCAR
jgi:hypothetical protein